MRNHNTFFSTSIFNENRINKNITTIINLISIIFIDNVSRNPQGVELPTLGKLKKKKASLN